MSVSRLHPPHISTEDYCHHSRKYHIPGAVEQISGDSCECYVVSISRKRWEETLSWPYRPGTVVAKILPGFECVEDHQQSSLRVLLFDYYYYQSTFARFMSRIIVRIVKPWVRMLARRLRVDFASL